ncbi:histidinol dehydrogenase [candidate division KSB1 bacterium]|nr:histidinol dehydrogenase [candidate division KSB1 bacterium]
MIRIYRYEEIGKFIDSFESRRQADVEHITQSVKEILRNVHERGDDAVAEYALRFDRTDVRRFGFFVPESDLDRAYEELDSNLRSVLHEARDNIARFHAKSMPQSWLTWEQDGVVLGQRVIPLQRVGVYVPGGRAAYPSSLLMGVVPAQVAGVEEILVATPADDQGKVNPTILATARLLGIRRVLRIGGAHAVAALAYGTSSVPRVDKIVGPGNAYVAAAKQLLFGQVGIDMVAGPSEVLIIADQAADPDCVAADLLAQAEHDPLASAILLTSDRRLADEVARSIVEQTAHLQRREIIVDSLKNYGAILVTPDLRTSLEICNRLAPEHLGLHLQDAWNLLGEIRTAGAIFLGSYSPETVGDYWAGPNHVLPTNGSGRFFSPLRTEDFLKTSSILSYTAEAMHKHGDKIVRFAQAEGLSAHANAIRVRMARFKKGS